MEMARRIVHVLADKKGEDILLLDIQEVSPVADYFVICSGTSDRMLKTLAEAVEDEVKDRYRLRPRLEGMPHEGWVLADYGAVILHLFSTAQRNYYNLEDLWSEGKVIVRLQ